MPPRQTSLRGVFYGATMNPEQTCDASSFEEAVNRLRKAKGSDEALARKHAQDAWQ